MPTPAERLHHERREALRRGSGADRQRLLAELKRLVGEVPLDLEHRRPCLLGPPEAYRGTILAQRWGHRESTDIDLTVPTGRRQYRCGGGDFNDPIDGKQPPVRSLFRLVSHLFAAISRQLRGRDS